MQRDGGTQEKQLTLSGECKPGCPDTTFKLYHDGKVAVNQKNGAKGGGE